MVTIAVHRPELRAAATVDRCAGRTAAVHRAQVSRGGQCRPGIERPRRRRRHATGYLAGAAALLALAAVQRGEPPRSAQLSLAQTALWLLDAGRTEREQPPEPDRTPTWFDRRIVVAEQGPAEPPDQWWAQPQRRPGPPCPGPEGGWPRELPPYSAEFDTLERGLIADGVVVMHRTARAEDGSQVVVVVVVTTLDPSRIEELLRPHYVASLCVAPAGWTRAQFAEFADCLGEHRRSWELFDIVGSRDALNQPVMRASIIRVPRPMADWAADLPQGILVLHPWLVPVRSRA
jgi:hypothetical protein